MQTSFTRAGAALSYALSVCLSMLPIIAFTSYFILYQDPKVVKLDVGDIYL
jgi:hypothetical protein